MAFGVRRNRTRLGAYYWGSIGSSTRALDWCQNQRPWMTLECQYITHYALCLHVVDDAIYLFYSFNLLLARLVWRLELSEPEEIKVIACRTKHATSHHATLVKLAELLLVLTVIKTVFHWKTHAVTTRSVICTIAQMSFNVSYVGLHYVRIKTGVPDP